VVRSRFRKVVNNIITQFHIPVEVRILLFPYCISVIATTEIFGKNPSISFFQVRRLPVGDGLWIARHKQSKKEYVLDFIVERKNVDDLRGSIRDNRYRDQKLRLQVYTLRSEL
jgi:ERCC4 domain